MRNDKPNNHRADLRWGPNSMGNIINRRVLKERIGRAVGFLVINQVCLSSAAESLAFLRTAQFSLGVRSAAQRFINSYQGDLAFKEALDFAFQKIRPASPPAVLTLSDGRPPYALALTSPISEVEGRDRRSALTRKGEK